MCAGELCDTKNQITHSAHTHTHTLFCCLYKTMQEKMPEMNLETANHVPPPRQVVVFSGAGVRIVRTKKRAEYTQPKTGLAKFFGAFHPEPQTASGLGRNVTRSSNPHRNRKRFPRAGTIFVAHACRFKTQRASTGCDLRIASPICPYTPQIADPQAAIAESGPLVGDRDRGGQISEN